MPVRSVLFVLALVALVCGALPGRVRAQETITSDRPGIGSGSGVVAPGVAQVETGFGLGGGSGATDLSLGQLLVRFGVGGIELELFGNSLVVQLDDDTVGDEDRGFQAVGLGTKVPVVRSDRLSLSLQGTALTPTGSAEFGSDDWLLGVNALADVALSARAVLNANLGVVSGSGVDAVWSANLTPSWSLGGGVGIYAGWAGTFSSQGDTSFLEGGLAFLASRDVQLDLNGGWSVDTDAWFVGGGLAVRWGGS